MSTRCSFADVYDAAEAALDIGIESPGIPEGVRSSVGLGSAAINMQLESEKPAYRNAPDVVYGRAAAGYATGNVVYPLVGGAIAVGCAIDIPMCGATAAVWAAGGKQLVEDAQDKTEDLIRAFNERGRAAAERVQIARQNGYMTIDDWPEMKQANKEVLEFQKSFMRYFGIEPIEIQPDGTDSDTSVPDTGGSLWKLVSIRTSGRSSSPVDESSPYIKSKRECHKIGSNLQEVTDAIDKQISLSYASLTQCKKSKTADTNISNIIFSCSTDTTNSFTINFSEKILKIVVESKVFNKTEVKTEEIYESCGE